MYSIFLDTPLGEKTHSLLGLANFDFTHLPDVEAMGEDLMHQYQIFCWNTIQVIK